MRAGCAGSPSPRRHERVRGERAVGERGAALRQREEAQIGRRAGERVVRRVAGERLQQAARRPVEALDRLAQARRRSCPKAGVASLTSRVDGRAHRGDLRRAPPRRRRAAACASRGRSPGCRWCPRRSAGCARRAGAGRRRSPRRSPCRHGPARRSTRPRRRCRSRRPSRRASAATRARARPGGPPDRGRDARGRGPRR